MGRETNNENQETEDWIHARSSTVQLMIHRKLLARHQAGYTEAVARIRGWEAEDGLGMGDGGGGEGKGCGVRLESLTYLAADAIEYAPEAEFPRCPFREDASGDDGRRVCLHPRVHVEQQLVTPAICGACGYRQCRSQAAP